MSEAAIPSENQKRFSDAEIRSIAVKAFNEAIDADGYETSYEIIETAIKAALDQTTFREDNLDELVGGQPSRPGDSGLAYKGDEPGIVVELNGKMGRTDHNVSPELIKQNTSLEVSQLSKVAAPASRTTGLIEAAKGVLAYASDTYKKRNGHLGSFEDHSGEKCWIVPFDAFEALRSAVAATEGQTNG